MSRSLPGIESTTMRFPLQILSGGGPRLAALLAVAAAAAGGAGYYSFFVAQQAQYLEGRNFRLLGALAAQTEGAIESEARRFQTLAGEPKSATWTYLKTRRYRDADLPDALSFMHQPAVAYSLNASGGKFYVRIALTDKKAGPERAAPAPLRIPLPLIVAPIFKPKLPESAFDTVGLATQRGTTWFATGGHASELMATGLEALMRQAKRAPSDRPFSELVQTTVVDLSIGGTNYRLFAQPCCAFTDNDDRMMVIGLVEADELRAQSWAISTTLVKAAMLAILLALVLWPFIKLACLGPRQRVRTFDAFQVAASSVAALALLTIAGLDAYAYWRLNRDADVHLKALAGTIQDNFTAEMTSAVAQLSCLEDLQVPKPGVFGDLLGQDVSVVRGPAKAIAHCNGTLKDLSDPKNATASKAHARRDAAGSSHATPWPDWPYAYFESFSRIDADDKQQVKLATTRWVPSRVQVGTRRYVTDIRDRKEWKDEKLCPKGCVLESLWAWTSGEPQAVLSRRVERVEPVEGRTTGRPGRPTGHPVASGQPRTREEIVTLALYLPSVIRPVLPPGFEFAIIDGAGKVWFHSDRYRNAYEDFFAETDGNRRLRAQVLAHSAESLDLQYWGAPYRAFVRPLGPFDLTVVALQQKENAWALNREWLIVALLLLAVYLVWWVLALLVALGPDASWIWPDPARRDRYVHVSIVSLAILITCGIVATRVHGAALLWWAFGLPLCAWAATFALLRPRPSRAAAAGVVREPAAAYAVAAVLFLLVTAVVPGVLFFTSSFQLHVQSFMKRSDFQLTRALVERDTRLCQEYSDDRGKGRQFLIQKRLQDSPIDQYYPFFYNTSVTRETPGPEDCREPFKRPSDASRIASLVAPPLSDAAHAGQHGMQHADHAGDDFLIGLLEEYLPYYAEASVEWRELLHDHAEDTSWSSEVKSDQLTMTVAATSRPPRTVTSDLPALLSPASARNAPGERKPRATLAAALLDGVVSVEAFAIVLLAALLVGAACWMVWFITRRLFLHGVTESVRASARLTGGTGGKLFILCDAGTKAGPMLGASRLPLGPLAHRAHPEAALEQQLSELAREEPGAVLLIDDLDDERDNARVMKGKLSLIQQLAADSARTVVVRSQVAPADLAPRAFDAFQLIDWRDSPDTAVIAASPSSPSRAAQQPHLTPNQTLLEQLLASEGRGHVLVRQVCDRLRRSSDVRDGLLTRPQLLEEIAERAAPCYRRLWELCSDDEQLVLSHVARDGWVHHAAQPIVRRLLARRLLEKDPALRLMNATFESFVLSSACRAEVTRLESSVGVSTWDQLRLPFGVIVVTAAVFLFATQRELYNAILGLTTTAAVSVPSLIRAVGMLAGRRLGDDGGVKV
jgi:hypothetical protein